MDGIQEMTGAGMTREVEGRTYRFAALTTRDYGEIERRILQLRPDPLEALAARARDLPEVALRRLAELAYQDLRRGPLVRYEELCEWLESEAGLRFRTFLSLRHDQPGITEPEAADVLDALRRQGPRQAEEMLDATDGMPSGN